MNLIISQPLQLIIIEYLTSQPYKDVAGLIAQLQRLQPAQTAPMVLPGPGSNGKDEEAIEENKEKAPTPMK